MSYAVERLSPLVSDVFEVENLVAFGAAGGGDLEAVALGLADHGAGDRRRNRDAALAGIRFGIADDHVFALFLGVLVDDLDGRPELHGVAAQLLDVDDVGEREQGFELLDAALVEALLLLGGVIFGVFAEIAVGARLGNGGDDARALVSGAMTIILGQRGVAGWGHRNLVGHRLSARSSFFFGLFVSVVVWWSGWFGS